MPTCPTCIDHAFQFLGGPFVFSLSGEEVLGYASRSAWDQAAMNRFVAKVEAFYDALPEDEKEAFSQMVQGR